jgi:fimbrial chaperone protein
MTIQRDNPGRAFNFAGTALLLFIFCFAGFAPKHAIAGEWRVSPIRLDLGSDARSGMVSVINEGAGRFQVQMKAARWDQDAEGKDQYTNTDELVFFPKMMIFDKAEERALRVGIKIPAGTKEKTYRLFIEEIPEPRKADSASIAVTIRFGVPVFVKPLKEELKGEISKQEFSKGEYRITVKNSGNAHFVINSLVIKGTDLKGGQTFTKKLDGWYLLSGVSRVYAAAIPREVCAETVKLDVEVKTNSFILNGKHNVDKALCQ